MACGRVERSTKLANRLRALESSMDLDFAFPPFLRRPPGCYADEAGGCTGKTSRVRADCWGLVSVVETGISTTGNLGLPPTRG